jgi:hypothetical protein
MLRNFLPLALLVGLAGGCYTEADVGYGYGGADLAYVSPGVYVVAGYDYPVFFSEGVYWRFYGGSWYRSPYRDRGWAYARTIPSGVRSVRAPESYAHYRPSGAVRTQRYQAFRGTRPVMREHRR